MWQLRQDLSLDNPHDLGNPPSRVPVVWQWAGVVVLVVLVAVSAVWAVTEHWRRAAFALGSAMLWLATLRATCDSQILGVLAVRSVRFDVALCVGVGAMLVFLASSVDSLGS